MIFREIYDRREKRNGKQKVASFSYHIRKQFLRFSNDIQRKKIGCFLFVPYEGRGGGGQQSYFVFTSSMRDKNTTFVMS